MALRAGESVGIDLGTTYSSLAYMDSNLLPRIVQDSSGSGVIPSVIYFDEAGVVVGEVALQQSKYHAERTVQFIKVHMGDRWEQRFHGHVHTPESLSAIILRNLLREAEPQIGPVRSAVITVPAYFTERRRLATQQAGEIAGLEILGTLNEPMAATLAYGLHRQGEEQLVVVYDLGGGTFDVTIVRIAPDEIEELAINGNRQLGGRDWDKRLIDFIADEFQKAHQINPRTDLQAMQNLRLECELAKRRLSGMLRTPLVLHACGREYITEVTRQQFEELTAGLLHTTQVITELALDDAGLDWSQISRVVLVGGSTKMPAVRQMLKQTSGLDPDVEVNPVLAVALGAAIYAHTLDTGGVLKPIRRLSVEEEEAEPEPVGQAPDEPRGEPVPTVDAGEPSPGIDETVEYFGPPAAETVPKVRFVTAHGVGVLARAGEEWKNVVLIPRNTQVPASASRQFVTASATGGGTYVKIEITQGDTPEPELAEVLGTGRIAEFPRNEPPGQPVDVIMEFNPEGRLHIKAVYVNTGQEIEMSLDIPDALRPEEVRKEKLHLDKTTYLNLFDPDRARSVRHEQDEEDPHFDPDQVISGIQQQDDEVDDDDENETGSGGLGPGGRFL